MFGCVFYLVAPRFPPSNFLPVGGGFGMEVDALSLA